MSVCEGDGTCASPKLGVDVAPDVATPVIGCVFHMGGSGSEGIGAWSGSRG